MSIVGNNIRALRTLYGDGRDITQAELAEIAGVTRETVNKWESGSISNVRTSNINRLREYFGLSVDDLRSESAGLAARLKQTRGELERSRGTHGVRTAPRVPLVPMEKLFPNMTITVAVEKVEIPGSIAKAHPNAVAFIVEDDNMSKVLPKGCHALVDFEATPGTNSVVVAQLSSDGYNKRVIRRLHRGANKVMLSAESFGESEDYVLDASEVRIIGVVVWYQSAGGLV